MAASTQVGASTVITVDAQNTITLANVSLGSLHHDDFAFRRTWRDDARCARKRRLQKRVYGEIVWNWSGGACFTLVVDSQR